MRKTAQFDFGVVRIVNLVKILQKEPLVAEIGFDRAGNGPSKVWESTTAELMTGGMWCMYMHQENFRTLVPHRFVQVTAHFSAFFEIYNIYRPLHLWNY